MKTFTFYKYQGTGNDFIIIDDRSEEFDDTNIDLIQKLCHRKFGIGSDGLILIRNHSDLDFTMLFFNPDGSKSFCGNGSRCAVKFCYDLKIISDPQTKFEAIDGIHTGKMEKDSVSISVNDLKECRKEGDDYFLHTGSPHYIHFDHEIEKINVVNEGRKIRYAETFSPGGTNVNFVENCGKFIKVRTYERGVENETLSCGSGVTASALCSAWVHEMPSPVSVVTPGGILKVDFKKENQKFSDIVLTGPAEMVFKGEING